MNNDAKHTQEHFDILRKLKINLTLSRELAEELGLSLGKQLLFKSFKIKGAD